MSLIDNIRRCRKSKGFSQEYVASQLGMSQSCYARLEQDGPRCEQLLARLAGVLELAPEALLRYNEAPASSSTSMIDPTIMQGQLAALRNLLSEKDAEITFLRQQLELAQINLSTALACSCHSHMKEITR